MSAIELLLDAVSDYAASIVPAPCWTANLVHANGRYLAAIGIDDELVVREEGDRAYQAIDRCLRSFREYVALRTELEATVEVLHGRRAANVTQVARRA